MTTEKLDHKKFFSLAAPNILTGLSIPLAGLFDAAFLGHLEDTSHLAGVALAILIFDYLYWGFGFLRMGTTGLTAQAHGAGHHQEQINIFHRAFFIAIAIGILIILMQIPIANLSFHLLTGAGAVENMGQEYYYARVWGSIPALCIYAISGWLLGKHKVKSVLLIAAILNGFNIFFDWWFIIVQNKGAMGAGFATMLSEWIALFVGLYFIYRNWPQNTKIDLKEVLNKSKLIKLFQLNVNLMIRTFALITVFALFTNISAILGVAILAANALLIRLLSLASYFIDGFAYALEILAGTYHGAEDPISLRRSLKIAFHWNLGVVIFFIMGLVFFDRSILGLLTNHPELISQAHDYRMHLALVIVIASPAYVLDGYYIGMSEGTILRNSTVIGLLLGFAPLALGALHFQSIDFLWWSLIFFMGVRTFILARKIQFIETL